MEFYRNNTCVLYHDDCRNMAELPYDSVHCVVTSPPYWGLRKYAGVLNSIFDGKDDCPHEWRQQMVKSGAHHAGETNPGKEGYTKDKNQWSSEQGQFCLKCGAWRGQLGAEPTPALYIQHLVQIFQEVKRVLRSDGVVFLNIGDSMASAPPGNKELKRWQHGEAAENIDSTSIRRSTIVGNLKPLDKCLIPFRLAIALQEDGWYLRQDIIWHKPNAMPESVNSPRWVKHKVKVKAQVVGTSPQRIGAVAGTTQKPQRDAIGGVFQGAAEYRDCPGCPKCLPNDGLVLRKGSWRPTEAHEYILMLTKTDAYYCDGEAVRAAYSPATFPRMLRGVGAHKYARHPEMAGGGAGNQERLNIRDVFEHWQYTGQATKDYKSAGAQNPSDAKRRIIEAIKKNESGANLRSVWKFPTQSYRGPHYATFPEKLPEICIKAGTPEHGVCAECGKPWARILKIDRPKNAGQPDNIETGYREQAGELYGNEQHMTRCLTTIYKEALQTVTQTLGWKATCKCQTDAPVVPATVLDPFTGAGTTLFVASKLGRRSVGYEISEEYCQLTVARLGRLP